MSELCRFLGVVITMFGDDHNPPHFHVKYGEYKALIAIDGSIVKGMLPKEFLRMYFAGWRNIKTN